MNLPSATHSVLSPALKKAILTINEELKKVKLPIYCRYVDINLWHTFSGDDRPLKIREGLFLESIYHDAGWSLKYKYNDYAGGARVWVLPRKWWE